jgi:hypothetical protein
MLKEVILIAQKDRLISESLSRNPMNEMPVSVRKKRVRFDNAAKLEFTAINRRTFLSWGFKKANSQNSKASKHVTENQTLR